MGGRTGRGRRPTPSSDEWTYLLEHGESRDREPVGEVIFTSGLKGLAYAHLSERRHELQDIAKREFDKAGTLRKREEIVRDYVSHFPQLAFDINSWFWDVYWDARARQNADDRCLLRAVARGAVAPAPAWMPKKRWRASQLQLAKRRLGELKRKPSCKTLYKCWRESRSLDPAVVKKDRQRYLLPLIQEIETATNYTTSANELSKHGLAAVLSKAISKQFHLRERDLHDATP